MSEPRLLVVLERESGVPGGARWVVVQALVTLRALWPGAESVQWTGKLGERRDPHTSLDAALAEAEPTPFKIASGLPARLALSSRDGVELILSWPVAPAERGPTAPWRLAIAWPSSSDVDAMRVATGFSTIFDPKRVTIGACSPRELRPADAWLVAGPQVAAPKAPDARFALGRLMVEVAHEAGPTSAAPEHVAARRALFERMHGAVAAPPAPLARPDPPPPPRVAPPQAVGDDTVPLGSFVPTNVDLPFSPSPAGSAAAAPRGSAATPPPGPSTAVVDGSAPAPRVGDETVDASALGSIASFLPAFMARATPEVADEPTAPLDRALPMTLEDYAAFQAAVRRDGGLTPEVAARFGVADEPARASLQERFRSAFAADPPLAERFVDLMKQRLG